MMYEMGFDIYLVFKLIFKIRCVPNLDKFTNSEDLQNRYFYKRDFKSKYFYKPDFESQYFYKLYFKSPHISN